ncbi:MAG: gamma carbonic anhydrase family protein, partial [Clostridia bacterium]
MLYKYKSAYPRISENVFVAENASIIGDVTLGTQASVWFGAVLRGDVSHIIIGAGSNVQDNVTIHVSAGIPAVIGCGVTVGHNAVLHGCEIGDNTLI